jgi:hypothetical protein
VWTQIDEDVPRVFDHPGLRVSVRSPFVAMKVVAGRRRGERGCQGARIALFRGSVGSEIPWADDVENRYAASDFIGVQGGNSYDNTIE